MTPAPPSPAPPALAKKPGFAIARGLSLKVALGFAGFGVLLMFVPVPGALAAGFLFAVIGIGVLFQTSCVMRWVLASIVGGVLLVPGFFVQSGWRLLRERAAEARAKRAAEEMHQAELGRVPQLENEMNSKVAEGRWEDAARVYEQIKRIDPHHTALADAWGKIGPELKKLQAERANQARRQTLAQGMEATRKVAKDRTLCATPKAISDAWNKLKVARKEDPEWNTATALAAQLEVCRKAAEGVLSQGMRKVMMGQRIEWAQRAEKEMLKKGMDMGFTLQGPYKDRVRIKWALMSKVIVFQLTDDGSMREGAFLPNLQKIGFRRVEFTDGWNYDVYYTLEPQDESAGGRIVLAGLGIGERLTLR